MNLFNLLCRGATVYVDAKRTNIAEAERNASLLAIAEAQQYMRTPSEYTHCLKFFILDIFRKFGKSIFLLKARASVTGIYKWIKSYS